MKLYGNINDLLSSNKSAHKKISLVDICASVYNLNDSDAIIKTNKILRNSAKNNADTYDENE